VGLRPAARRALGEKLVGVRALFAGDTPRQDLVGKVSGVALVIEREPLEGPVADPKRIEFVLEVPLRLASGARHRGRVVDVVRLESPAIEVV
jgi:hypothetical protein